MVTQTITFNLTQKKLDDIIMRSEEIGREIYFVALDPDGEEINLGNYEASFEMVKPSGNFVYAEIINGKLTQTPQMTSVFGVGFYNVRILSGTECIYSGEGSVIIDDNCLNRAILEDVSEVNRLVFPDDFLTTDDIGDFAEIDDSSVSRDYVWSSRETNDRIIALLSDDEIEIDKTWSSVKINQALKTIYSADEQEFGKWINNKTLYRKVIVLENLVTGANRFSIPANVIITHVYGMFNSPPNYADVINLSSGTGNISKLSLDDIHYNVPDMRLYIGSDYTSLLSGAYATVVLEYYYDT